MAYAQGKGEVLELGIMNADGRNPQPLSVQGWNPVWSPDGKHLVYTTRDAGSNDLWVVDADGSNARALVATTRDRNTEIYTMQPDGSAVRNLSRSPGTDDGGRGGRCAGMVAMALCGASGRVPSLGAACADGVV